MELINREMPADYEIIDTGDLHYWLEGLTNEKAIDEMFAYVQAEKNRFVIIKGDIVKSKPVEKVTTWKVE